MKGRVKSIKEEEREGKIVYVYTIWSLKSSVGLGDCEVKNEHRV